MGPMETGRARWPAWFALVSLVSVSGRELRAGNFGVGGPATGMVRARLPGFGFRARTSGREFQGWRPGGRHGSRSSPRFRFSGANLGPGIPGVEARRPTRFALDSPLTLCFRFPGANSGPGISGLEARRPERFALDSPRTLYFRFSGANLGPEISGLEARRPAWFALDSPVSVSGREFRAGNFRVGGPAAGMIRARLPGFGFRARTSGREFQGWRPGDRLFPGAVCSPLLANPCGSVPGSKFFTHFPRRHLPPAAISKARFAPPSPLSLVVPSRGANSSHISRATCCPRRQFQRRGLLPTPR